jgi:putative ABC transport system substrate-binding protein
MRTSSGAVLARRTTMRVMTLTGLVLILLVLGGSGASRADTQTRFHIGFLTSGKASAFDKWLNAFRTEFRRLSSGEFRFTAQFGEGRSERMAGLADELVALDLDALVVHGAQWGILADKAARRRGKTVPVVFAVDSDPVGKGAVASLAKPGGNITGLSDFHANLVGKRMEILKEAIPSVSSVAVLWDPARGYHQNQKEALVAVTNRLGVTLYPVAFSKPDDFAAAKKAIEKLNPDALMHFGYPLFGAYHKQFAAFARDNKLAAMGTIERTARAGFLMAYGADFPDMYRNAAVFVDKILKGAKPADLPVQQPTKFDLVINLNTAKALGITVPASILLRATKVIE